uniref:DUF4336 domain-containing protein n=1 Tax=Chromera velia CCMP2878 TaxID=1169474 RepID=A0A0G4HQZ9_9ALVE|mmetsp:Transcript_47028/g.92848  ORF Transcript_47028/g.92848 Transcript_47028/m.92848 type:complete len:417 (+) Transcript_47028:56-1306(+)|eukprot:Cvel_8058.t1-p1 / transcript=Cvel_8058.t1 / gene=Cvel_8058 / organism=Chromera_velia_CCMP2878 / gene_product=hypothetical protein / transcript_product=hypothetical protein / location=Cvel_scaffold436:20964-25696(-) / protein_length=416 / sequence_SO=supercontig / SO=protein_coding / is_pseudo=false
MTALLLSHATLIVASLIVLNTTSWQSHSASAFQLSGGRCRDAFRLDHPWPLFPKDRWRKLSRCSAFPWERPQSPQETAKEVDIVAITEEAKKGGARPKQEFFNPIWSPYVKRPTVRREVERDVWIFEQTLGILNVTEITRMTAIRLQEGGLFIYAPIAPTVECLELLQELSEPVKYIVLPVTAVEHKLFCKAFANIFSNAEVWVAPGQFSFPLPLPLGFRVDGVLTDDAEPPFSKEIKHATFSLDTAIGSSVEIACFHERSRTLLSADSIQFVDSSQRSEQRLTSSLQVFFLSAPAEVSWSGFFPGVPQAYTFCLDTHYVPPQLRAWVFETVPEAARRWVDKMGKWTFIRHISCHFDSPTPFTPQKLKEAFVFLYKPQSAEAERLLPAGSAPFIESVRGFLRDTIFRDAEGGRLGA